MQKDDDFLKSSVEAPVHRKVLLEDKNISPKTQEAFDKLCEKYNDIISKNSGDIGKTMLVEMEIDTGNHPPIASKPYTLPLKHYDWVQREIETLEKAGIIERSISPWASPMVIVPKKSTLGEPPRRMCMDYRRINKLQPEVTKADGGTGCISLIPLPKIDELYAKLKGYKVFSSLDLRSGYYRIDLKDSAKPKSAFVLSSLAKYQFNRVPFRLAQAPAYFQKLINDVLKGCNFAMGYLDDIIIYSRLEKEHLEHLEEIFIRLKAAGLKLKLEKCCFFKKHIQYLGHLISADGIQPLPEKLESIAKMPAPKNPKEVKQFSWTSRLLQEIHSKICRYLTSTNTPNQKRHRIQMDTRMRELFPDLERIFTASTNTQIPRPPSQLHTLHRCIKICIRRHTDTTQQWHGPPYHLCKWTNYVDHN